MECGSSLTACSAHGSTPGQFFCPGAKHSFCCKEHCCHLTSFDGRIIAQKSDLVNRYSGKREKKQEMGNGKLAQGCRSGVVGGGVLDVPWGTADLHRLSLKWETPKYGV